MTDGQFGLFGTDPWWLVIGKAVVIFGLLVLLTLFTIWWERRVVSRMQNRIGPNRVGPQGLLQSLMDGFKLAFKEEVIPKAAHLGVYWIAPVISATAAFIAFAVIPFGPTVSVFGVETPLQLTDFPVSVLYVLAIASIGVYGLVLAGWSSGSTYPLLGGLRSTAQVISYEIAMGLSFVAVFIYAGSMATSEIVVAQQPIWFAVILLPSFLIYVTSMVGETNRAPFDLPEAEGELVGGFHTEYSSLKFALFFLAEYINMVTVSALATTLFLGGYLAPWPLSLWEGANSGWLPVVWWLIKVQLFIFVFIWLRGGVGGNRVDRASVPQRRRAFQHRVVVHRRRHHRDASWRLVAVERARESEGTASTRRGSGERPSGQRGFDGGRNRPPGAPLTRPTIRVHPPTSRGHDGRGVVVAGH